MRLINAILVLLFMSVLPKVLFADFFVENVCNIKHGVVAQCVEWAEEECTLWERLDQVGLFDSDTEEIIGVNGWGSNIVIEFSGLVEPEPESESSEERICRGCTFLKTKVPIPTNPLEPFSGTYLIPYDDSSDISGAGVEFEAIIRDRVASLKVELTNRDDILNIRHKKENAEGFLVALECDLIDGEGVLTGNPNEVKPEECKLHEEGCDCYDEEPNLEPYPVRHIVVSLGEGSNFADLSQVYCEYYNYIEMLGGPEGDNIIGSECADYIDPGSGGFLDLDFVDGLGGQDIIKDFGGMSTNINGGDGYDHIDVDSVQNVLVYDAGANLTISNSNDIDVSFVGMFSGIEENQLDLHSNHNGNINVVGSSGPDNIQISSSSSDFSIEGGDGDDTIIVSNCSGSGNVTGGTFGYLGQSGDYVDCGCSQNVESDCGNNTYGPEIGEYFGCYMMENSIGQCSDDC